MPRKRKAARAYRSPERPALEAVRLQFEDEWAWFDLSSETFYVELPTPDLRAAFAEMFPEEFLETFGLVEGDADRYPASITYGQPFRRPLEYFEENQPQVPFDPPDLRGVEYRDRQRVMAEARYQWWTANGWPMTESEIRWISRSTDQPATVQSILAGREQ